MDKTQFKVGSLDQLMELMGVFSKLDQQIDGSVKRNEKLYFEMCKEMSMKPELILEVNTGRRGNSQPLSVEDYILNFKWETVRFQMDKSLKLIGQKMAGIQKNIDDRLKKLLDEQNTIKHKLN